MKRIVDLLFEAKLLKELPRSGYHFLGSGKESVAEHSFMTAIIGFVLSRTVTGIDAEKLILMCLLHDLPEARTGDLNYVQKKYAQVDEEKAICDLIRDIPFGDTMKAVLKEFNEGQTTEAMLARDADQLSFVLELKTLSDTGSTGPEKWLPVVMNRLKTEAGKELAEQITKTGWDEWWRKNYVD